MLPSRVYYILKEIDYIWVFVDIFEYYTRSQTIGRAYWVINEADIRFDLRTLQSA